MTEATRPRLVLEPHAVTLHYPGAEGVRFHDAVLVLSNPSEETVENVALQLRVLQADTTLLDETVDLKALGATAGIAPRGSSSVSVFRALQHHVKGFGSKVNLFGYKAVLNWSFRVEASFTSRQGEHGAGAWNMEWRPAAEDPTLVEVVIVQINAHQKQ